MALESKYDEACPYYPHLLMRKIKGKLSRVLAALNAVSTKY